MSATYSTPGVYIRELEVFPAAPPRMSVTGFAGQAERGPLNYAQPVDSWGRFQDIFGSFTAYSYLAYSVFGFFLNGGIRCYVARVMAEDYGIATTGFGSIRIQAINPGLWGNNVSVQIAGQSSHDLQLAVLARDAAAGDACVLLDSAAGLGAGDSLTLVNKRNPQVRIAAVVKSVNFDTAAVTLAASLPAPLSAGSAAVGRGFRLTAAETVNGVVSTQETFDDLSMNPAHPRYFADLINGRPPQPDYQQRLAAGLSMLIQVADQTVGKNRPRPADTVLPLSGFVTTTTADLAAGATGIQLATLANLSPGMWLFVTDNTTAAQVEIVSLQPAQSAVTVSYISPAPAAAIKSGASVSSATPGSDGRLELDYRYYTGYSAGAYFRPGQTAVDVSFIDLLSGMALYETVPEIGLIAIPDLIVPDLYQALGGQPPTEGILFARVPLDRLNPANLRQGQFDMLVHCGQMGDRSAILDSPRGAEINRGATPIEQWPAPYPPLPQSPDGALYYPWIRENAADFGGLDLWLPPCGHIAGIYARVEAARGVGKAPANEIVAGVVELETCLDDAGQGVLNVLGINCLRALPNRGLRVWGARTLSPDPSWTYVSVRRVYLALVKQILVNLQFAVFEPNSQPLRERVVSTLTLFLLDQFQAGSLAGAQPADAFFVKCDDETNPPEVVAAGQLITRIGLAIARPAEFIVVTILRNGDALSVM